MKGVRATVDLMIDEVAALMRAGVDPRERIELANVVWEHEELSHLFAEALMRLAEHAARAD